MSRKISDEFWEKVKLASADDKRGLSARRDEKPQHSEPVAIDDDDFDFEDIPEVDIADLLANGLPDVI